jgi:hypothetical protein
MLDATDIQGLSAHVSDMLTKLIQDHKLPGGQGILISRGGAPTPGSDTFPVTDGAGTRSVAVDGQPGSAVALRSK